MTDIEKILDRMEHQHESEAMRQEKTIHRQWVTILVLIFVVIATNAGWLWYESQWQTVQTTQEVQQDIDTGDGDLGTIIGIGDNYGTGEANSTNDN